MAQTAWATGSVTKTYAFSIRSIQSKASFLSITPQMLSKIRKGITFETRLAQEENSKKQ